MDDIKKEELKNKIAEMIPNISLGTGVFIVNETLNSNNPFLHGVGVLASGYLLSKSFITLIKKQSQKTITETIYEINSLYNEFLDSYSKLNHTFNISNPIELYGLYHYLLFNGYFSGNKRFVFSGELKNDRFCYDNYHLGCNIFTGYGVCRHIASLFSDILNHENIESSTIVVNYRNYEINEYLSDNPREEDIEIWINTRLKGDIYSQKEIRDYYNSLSDEEKKYINFELVPAKQILLEKIFGNHAICVVKYNNHIYYLDPTNYEMYQLENGKLYDYEYAISIKKIGTFISCFKLKYYIKTLKLLSEKLPCVSQEEENKLVMNIDNLCINNKDIFEQFYNDNKELYQEISNKVLSLKR